MGELSGRVAIVTGGAAGIGLGISTRLCQEGATVILADIDEAEGQKAAAELGAGAAFYRVDVSDQGQLAALCDFAASEFGRLDIMVNNAGIGGKRHGRLLDDDFADFDKVVGINLLGVMAGTREATRVMKENGGGSIVNISSVGGVTAAAGNWTYHATKSAVVFFTKCAALDVGDYNVRVNCIAPSNIETSILARSMAGHIPEGPERDAYMVTLRKYIQSRQPLKMQGHVDDIAEAILFLGSQRSRYITGMLMPVDGGQLAGNVRPENSPLSHASGAKGDKA
jgi:NAD(P)-dependent dehydrogenase (short-subunit alcohol dehydrogenase family)